MLPLKHPLRWQLAGLFLACSVLILALIPMVWPWSGPDIDAGFINDKWLHGITFAFLTVWYTGQFSRRAYIYVVVGLLLFGAVIELCQLMTSYRYAGWKDFFADALGILAGLTIAWFFTGGWSQRLEKKLSAC